MLRSTATIPACGATTYHHHDGLGSVIMLTNAGGSVVERYRYDVFGHVTILDATHATRATSAHHNRFLFTGREWLAQLELCDSRNRSYSTTLGRFLQTDPIRFESGDGNLYRYVGNSVVNFTDAKGLKKDCCDCSKELAEAVFSCAACIPICATVKTGIGALACSICLHYCAYKWMVYDDCVKNCK